MRVIRARCSLSALKKIKCALYCGPISKTKQKKKKEGGKVKKRLNSEFGRLTAFSQAGKPSQGWEKT